MGTPRTTYESVIFNLVRKSFVTPNGSFFGKLGVEVFRRARMFRRSEDAVN